MSFRATAGLYPQSRIMEMHQMRTESGTDRAHWLSLIVLCAGTLMIVLDTTVVNVALPSIQRELHFSSAGLA